MGQNMRITIVIIAVVVIVGGVILIISAHLWRSRTAAIVARIEQLAPTSPAPRFTVREIEGLPPPVQRYFRVALQEGLPIVRHARIHQRGQFLVRPEKNEWGSFIAIQDIVPEPYGFVWDASIRMAPGLSVRVRDALVDGKGSMRGTLFGLKSVIRMENTPEITSGALHRYLAEAVWVPTALLPSAGVTWTAVDDSTARATATAGTTTVSVEFRFGPDGLVRSIHVPDRAREVKGCFVPTPWQGTWFRYGERGGMRVPLAGEVAWVLPEGPQPYWRGEIVMIEYEFRGLR
jgi:hypothetical protein